MNPPLVKELVYWITERENMRVRKEAGGKWPHSTDPVMANNRYTNVRREDDKVTKWLADNWRYPRADLTKWMCLARMVNYTPSMEEIQRATRFWDPEIIAEVLWERADRGEKVWSSAYMITTCGKAMDKVTYVVDHVSDNVPEVVDCPTLAEAYEKLRTVNGLGSFLAGQIVADLKNTPGVGLFNAPDNTTFSVPGPGSLRGLTYFFGASITATGYNRAIGSAWQLVQPELPIGLQDLSMQDFQNCFCEFSKFMRGYGRNKYGN
jgi:hypothetical protein